MEVVQALLLFEYNMWVVTPLLDKYLKGFHHRAVRRMAGMVPKHQRDGTWVYHPLGRRWKWWDWRRSGIYCPPPEHGRAIHCDLSYHKIVFGGRVETINAPIQAIM